MRFGHISMRRRAAFVVALAAFFTMAVSPSSVRAGSSSVPPYSSSDTEQYCDSEVPCAIDVSADHATGSLAVDVEVLDTGYVTQSCWYGQCYPSIWYSGAWAKARIISNHTVPDSPVHDMTFTVLVDTGQASATATPGSRADTALRAYARHSSCGLCGGSSGDIVLASSTSQPSSDPALRSLTFTFKNHSGKVPAGTVSVIVELRAHGRGPGVSEAKASGVVTSVSWS